MGNWGKEARGGEIGAKTMWMWLPRYRGAYGTHIEV